MTIRPIRNQTDHVRALSALTALIEADPPVGSDEADQLEVLATLVEKYEDRHFPIDRPSPVDAIRFRMDQQGLKPKDLVPLLGAASRVSEVLGGKRPLSLAMIRALHEKLAIPADVLIGGSDSAQIAADVDPENYPVKVMHQRGYFLAAPTDYRKIMANVRDLLARLFAEARTVAPEAVLARSTAHGSVRKAMNSHAFQAWAMRVAIRAQALPLPAYRSGSVDASFLDAVAALSAHDDGPSRAYALLSQHGIALIIEPHLEKTYLDGGALLLRSGRPVIGLTLRHDRLDNFWFTLMHELVHIGWHLNAERAVFADDLSFGSKDALEQEADRLAAEALVPVMALKASALGSRATEAQVNTFAQRIGRHPCVVAGRLRKDAGDYTRFARLINAHLASTRITW